MKQSLLILVLFWTAGCISLKDQVSDVVGTYLSLALDTDVGVELQIHADGSYSEYLCKGIALDPPPIWISKELSSTGSWTLKNKSVVLKIGDRVERRLKFSHSPSRTYLEQISGRQTFQFVKEPNQPPEPMPLKRHGSP